MYHVDFVGLRMPRALLRILKVQVSKCEKHLPLYPSPLVGSWPLPVFSQPNAFSHFLCGWGLGGRAVSLDLRPVGQGTESAAILSFPQGMSLDFTKPLKVYNLLLVQFILMTHTNYLYHS